MSGQTEDSEIELQEKYGKVRNLIEDDFKRDPETEPYRSKYKAKAMLKEMKDVLVELFENRADVKYKTMLSVVLLHLGTISLDTEELSSGEDELNQCLETIGDDKNTADNILTVITAKNQLGILWSQRTQPMKAQKHLEEAEHLYIEFVKSERKPNSIHQHFNSGKEDDASPDVELDKLHTLTKFYLAQVYGALKDLIKSAIYCHETLRRQLETKEYEPIDWALNSATLSQFFMERLRFKQARHHLAAALYILEKYEEDLKNIELNEEESEAKKEELKHRSSDVYRCFSKYGIFLLEYSKNLNETLEPDEKLDKLYFDSLELSVYESQMTDTPVVMYEEARVVFLTTQKFINQAKEYYSLEDHASDYVEIVQDHSRLYKHLIHFEHDEDRQCKMNKKRLDLLESVLKELTPQYFMFACRQMWFEIGEIYHDMMSVKCNKLQQSDEPPTPHLLKKINHLAEQGICNFNQLLESLKDKRSSSFPQVLKDDLVRPTLIAHLYLGRFYHKTITPDKRLELDNTIKSYQCYKYIIDYCEKCPTAKDTIDSEYDVCKQMMELLSLKVAQLTGSDRL